MKQLFTLNPNLRNEQRRHSELLRLVLLFLIIITPLFTLTANLTTVSIYILVANAFAYLCILVAFALNRAGFVAVSGWLLIGGILTGVAIYLSYTQALVSEINITGPILVLPVIISGITIAPLAPLLVALASDILLTVILILRSDLPLTEIIDTLTTPVFLILLVGLFGWSFERSYARIVSQLTQRNRELEQINEQIAAKRNIELQIGDRINLLAAQVSAAFVEQNRGANEQLSAIVEVTTALEELNQTNEQIAQAAGQVAYTAREALEVAEKGDTTIRYSTDAMRMLHAKVGEMTTAMENLSNQAREIDQIIELITEVAEETNLLALNATIEAAGAREYGRRFAAVAGEVQRLANRSREAADAVRGVVSEVQDAIKDSTSASQQGLKEALELTGVARQVAEAIGGIVQMVHNTANLAQQISFSIQQQKSAGTQVLDTMRQISTVSDHVANSSQELMSSMVELNEAADQLKSIDLKPTNGEGPFHDGGSELSSNGSLAQKLILINSSHGNK